MSLRGVQRGQQYAKRELVQHGECTVQAPSSTVKAPSRWQDLAKRCCANIAPLLPCNHKVLRWPASCFEDAGDRVLP